MLTHGFFATSHRSPIFDGFHDPDQPAGPWATPWFAPDQVNQIIDWVMSAPDDGEAIGWQQDTVIHQLGVAEPDRTDILRPDPEGRYRIGWHSWPWIPMPAPDRTEAGQPPTPAENPARRAATVSSTAPGSEPVNGTGQAAQTEQVQYIGWRTIRVRPSTRGRAGFDVFAGGQRLTHADPFPAEPTHDQLDSFLSMRKRGLDLLIAEHDIGDEDLYTLLHGTARCPRYAALARTDQSAVLSLHNTLDEATRRLRDQARQDPRSRILGVQDLDGPFLPAQVQITMAGPEQTRTRTPTAGRHRLIPSTEPTPTSAPAIDAADDPRPPSPASGAPGQGTRTCTELTHPKPHGSQAPIWWRWIRRQGIRGTDPAPARTHRRSPTLDALGVLTGVLNMGLMAVAALTVAMTMIRPCHPRRLPPRHRATSTSFFSAPARQRRAALNAKPLSRRDVPSGPAGTGHTHRHRVARDAMLGRSSRLDQVGAEGCSVRAHRCPARTGPTVTRHPAINATTGFPRTAAHRDAGDHRG
jgi:hypothetical protein